MLDIAVSIVQGLTVVGLRGALVRGEADRLVEVVEWLQEFGERRVTVHAAAVDTVDIHGMTALVSCHSALRAGGGRLIVSMPSPRLHGELRRTGLDRVLRVVGDRHADPGDGALRHA
jgi:anti-anti-sigma factor